MQKRLITDEDQLSSWMNNAGRYPILSNEETLEIARRINDCKPGTSEHAKLVNKLTVHNLRLVIKFVNSFMKKSSTKSFGCPETVDYLQVGAIGLRRGVELYDPYSGFKLSTYAYPWIRSFVSRYNRKNVSLFHIPENAVSDSWKFQKYGFLCKKDGTKKDEKVCAELVNNVRAAMSVVSLETPTEMNSGDCVPLSSLIESNYSTIEYGKFSPEFEDIIESCNLSDMQVEILRSIYLEGLDIAKVSRMHGIDKNKVSILKESAIRSLRKAEGLV